VSRPVRSLLPAAEAALVAVTVAAAASFWRLFDDGSFFFRLALFAVGSHAIAIATRRRGWSLAAAGAASLVGVAVVVTFALYPHTTSFGIPTADTVHAMRTDFGDVWNQFQQVEAPTRVTVPFLLAAGLALWAAAFVADWAAFRLWVPFESIVPAGTVYVFASLFAASRARVASAALFAGAALVFILLHRVTRQQSAAGWVSNDVRGATNSLLRAGGALVAAAVVAAAVFGPNLPQATASALVGWRGAGTNDGGSRTTVSPLVQIKGRLVQQSNQELFVVQSDQRAYWRLTALDQFNGDIWSSNGEYEKAKRRLPLPDEASAPKVTAVQSYTISSLGTLWLPAAYQPAGLDGRGADIRFEPESGTLIVGTSLSNSDSLNYTVTSAIPEFDPAQLRGANGVIPADIAARDLALPAQLSRRVRDLAHRLTDAQPTTYDKAIALQKFFRDNFKYSLDAPAGHSDSAIESFLFETRTGFCEQFAGTYSAMARAVGIPARVAVGFTPGDADPTQPGRYTVRGEHAHAWPELYLPGQGWVAFEPTPSRGIPNAQQYTGVPEQQSTGGGQSATTVPSTEAAGTAETLPNGQPVPTTVDQGDDTGATGETTPGPAFWSRGGLGGRVVIGSAVVGVLAALYVIVVPLVYAAYRRRRRRRAADPNAKVRLAWQESAEAMTRLGVVPRGSETPAEFATRAQSAIDQPRYPELAAVVDAAEYSVDGVGDDQARESWEIARGTEQQVRRVATWQQKLVSTLDPRPPERRRPLRHHRRRGRRRADAPAVEVLELT
jgi:transglutaminase-like putative cysteine protease